MKLLRAGGVGLRCGVASYSPRFCPRTQPFPKAARVGVLRQSSSRRISMSRKANGFSILAVFLVLFGMVVAIPAANAQSTTDGAIGGTVTDPSGAVGPNAVVTSSNLGNASH